MNILRLDLNKLPDDKEHLLHEDSSSSAAGGYRKKKKDAKDDGKEFECRFCSLKFCKSQALGGHMNRHRQERRTETLNRARQLVLSNDNLALHVTPYLSCQPITAGGCYQSGAGGSTGDPTVPYRPLYSPRLFSAAGTIFAPAPPQPVAPPQTYPYSSPTRLVTYPPSQLPPIDDYYSGHVLGRSSAGSYTCTGGSEGGSWGRGPEVQQHKHKNKYIGRQ